MSPLEKKFYLPVPAGVGRVEAKHSFDTAARIILAKFPLAGVFSPALLPAGLLPSEHHTICTARIRGWATSVVYLSGGVEYPGSELDLIDKQHLEVYDLDIEKATLERRN